MCFSFKIKINLNELKEIFKELDFSQLKDNETILYPKQETYLITKNGIQKMKWGINLNFTSKKLINIRSETLYKKFPIYSKNTACIPIKSFFEWYKTPTNKKLPIEIFPSSKNSFIAAVCDENSFAIITKQSPIEIANIHNRVPCIFDERSVNKFLKEKLDINQTINSFTYIKPQI